MSLGQEVVDILNTVELTVTVCRWLAPTGDWLGDGKTAKSGIDPDTVVDGDHGPEALQVAADEVRRMIADLRRDLQALKS